LADLKPGALVIVLPQPGGVDMESAGSWGQSDLALPHGMVARNLLEKIGIPLTISTGWEYDHEKVRVGFGFAALLYLPQAMERWKGGCRYGR
jgi:hypothetical protein